jgi:ATP-binding cassette subfamily C (CFTR/MRP) protein 1
MFIAECPQNISPLATFGITVIILFNRKDDSFLTAQAFTAIALINLLTSPVIRFIQLMPQLLQCISNFERIQEYANLTNDERSRNGSTGSSKTANSSINLQPLFQEVPGQRHDHQKYVIHLKRSSFAWKKSSSPFLREIELKIPRGSITICIGSVGSGKTMLMESILGETVPTLGPAPSRGSSIAYCAQRPWLEHGTIQDNIIGVTQYDSNWYQTVIGLCQLDADLQALPRRDKTIVGSKSSSLSGGQLQRVVSTLDQST